MTGDQLRQLRESRGLTREALANDLGDCTASTINKWERAINPVPNWVAEKMLRTVRIELPLEDLHTLLDLAKSEGSNFSEVLSQAIREHLHGKTNITRYPSFEEQPTAKVAEELVSYKSGKAAG